MTTPTAPTQSQPQDTRSGQVGYHLALAIKAWCGRNASTYGPAYMLSQLWSQTYPNVNYISDGAMSLLKTIYADLLFGTCRKAHELTVGVLAPGGAVQSVGQLYAWLKPCGQPQFSGTSFAAIPAAASGSTAKDSIQGSKAATKSTSSKGRKDG